VKFASNSDTDHLIDRARRGDGDARQQLLVRHSIRLRRMVSVRLDRRLAARVDPSDVVQEALAEADRKLSDYLREQPLPFYPWLRQIAWERLVKLHRRHLRARKRSITREEVGLPDLPDDSMLQLAGHLVDSGTDPAGRVVRDEVRAWVQAALSRLGERDRELLVMRYLEGLSLKEIAAAMDLSLGAVKMRHVRALEALQRLLTHEGGKGGEGTP
jgi:RNA polymerase sigma-70 factor (ECF subfamily)